MPVLSGRSKASPYNSEACHNPPYSRGQNYVMSWGVRTRARVRAIACAREAPEHPFMKNGP